MVEDTPKSSTPLVSTCTSTGKHTPSADTQHKVECDRYQYLWSPCSDVIATAELSTAAILPSMCLTYKLMNIQTSFKRMADITMLKTVASRSTLRAGMLRSESDTKLKSILLAKHL